MHPLRLSRMRVETMPTTGSRRSGLLTMEISRIAIRMTHIVSRKITEEFVMITQSIHIGDRSLEKKFLF